jgi:hypothetical protein
MCLLVRSVHCRIHRLTCCAGVVVAADSTEGSNVAAANSQYAAQLAARDASDKFTASSCQTLVPLRKHREVQSGSSSSNDAACQASRCELRCVKWVRCSSDDRILLQAFCLLAVTT